MKLNKRMAASFALVAILLVTLVAPVWGQSPITRMRNVAITILTVTAGLTTDDLTVTDDAVVTDDLSVVDDATLASDLTFTPQAALTLTMNGYLTPTGTLQLVTAAGAVSVSGANIAPGTAGDMVILLNTGANTITFTETTGLISAGNIALGTLDSATLVYRGTSWYQIGASNN